jgi:hypothetical protein
LLGSGLRCGLRYGFGSGLRSRLYDRLRCWLWRGFGRRFGCWLLCDRLLRGHRLGGGLRGRFGDRVGREYGLWSRFLRSGLRDGLGGRLRDGLGGRLRDGLGGRLGDRVSRSLLWGGFFGRGLCNGVCRREFRRGFRGRF